VELFQTIIKHQIFSIFWRVSINFYKVTEADMKLISTVSAVIYKRETIKKPKNWTPGEIKEPC